jgi:hypothetical protein
VSLVGWAMEQSVSQVIQDRWCGPCGRLMEGLSGVSRAVNKPAQMAVPL